MQKILQNHLLCAFVANLKIDALYALYPESFCGKNLAIRKVFAFCDSAQVALRLKIWEVLQGSQKAKLINAWKWKGQIVFEHSPQNQFIETNDCQRKNLNLKKMGKRRKYALREFVPEISCWQVDIGNIIWQIKVDQMSHCKTWLSRE